MAAICFDYPSLAAQVTFTKAQEALVIDYWGTTEIVLTYVGASSQVLRFADATAAAFFQNDLERELLNAGWTLDVTELDPLRMPASLEQRPQAVLN